MITPTPLKPIARIYEVFPLLRPICGGQMRIIAFTTYSVDIRQILEHVGVEPEPPRVTPARELPLWDECDAQTVDGVHGEADWDVAAEPAPDYEVNQRVSSQGVATAVFANAVRRGCACLRQTTGHIEESRATGLEK